MNRTISPTQRLFLTVCAVALSFSAHSQALQVTPANVAPFTPQNLISNVFLGDGVEVTNITYGGVSSAIGYFTGGTQSIGIERGIVMTTGLASSVPNNGSNFANNGNGSNAFDANLDAIATQTLNDVSVYTITFIPTADTLRFRYAFASEEYPEYACSSFNDVFGFFIQGPGYPTPTNIAIIPNTNLPVSINNIHPDNPIYDPCPPTNAQYYNANAAASNNQPTYDGITDVFTAQAIVTPCQPYTIKLAIADVGDDAYDSGVFLEAKSFGTGSLRVEVATVSADGTVTEGCTEGSITFRLPSPVQQDMPIDYNVWGSATNGIDYQAIVNNLSIPAGQMELVIPVIAFEDNAAEGVEFIAIDVQRDPCNRDTVYVYLRDNGIAAPMLRADTTVCVGQNAIELNATLPIPVPTPPTFSNQQDFAIPPNGAPITSNINVFGVQPTVLGPEVIRSVCFNINHPWDDDLDIFLLSPGGQFLELTTDNGGNGDNYTNTCFTPTATNSIVPPGFIFAPASAAPFTGDWLPEGPWSDLWDGTYPTNGNWRLQVSDDANGFNGTLTDWTITFEPSYKIDYQWSPAAGLSCATCPITNANPSQTTLYTVLATDSYGCTVTDTVSIVVAGVQGTTAVQQNVSCFGGNDGIAMADLPVGAATATYQWNDPAQQTTQTATGLGAGTYNVVISDANGCTQTVSATVTQPTDLTQQTTQTNVLCFGESNGSAIVAAAGGTTPYEYLWSNGPTTANNPNLPIANYSVTITDANGCTEVGTTTVSQPNELSASTNSTPANCNGGSNGTVTISPTGGTLPYAYAWSDPLGQVTATAANLPVGNYTVTLSDANGCSLTRSVEVTEPSAIQVASSVQNVRCFGEANGSISVAPTGGASPYQYNWSSGESTANILGKTAGTYTVTLTDNVGCTFVETQTIAEPPVLFSFATPISVLCFGENTGEMHLDITGGVPGYAANWSGPNGFVGAGADLSNLFAGNYVATVTDASGCLRVVNQSIAQPSAPLALALPEVSDTICFIATDGTATVVPAGGTAPYNYIWDYNGQTTATLTGLSTNEYHVTVTDANGCTQESETLVLEKQQVFAYAEPRLPRCRDGADGSATVLSIFYGADEADVNQFNYTWSTSPAQTGATATNLQATQTYTVTATDAQGCSATQTVTVGNPTLLEAKITGSGDVRCFGEANGWASASGSGGTGPYTWFWSPGAATQTDSLAQGFPAGTYRVTITDARGCPAVESVTISQPPALAVEMFQTAVKCFGESTGGARAFPSGGVSPYNYIWWNGAQTPDIQNVAAGVAGLSVTDANGCIAPALIEIEQPEAPVNGMADKRDPTCFGGRDGEIRLTGTGGTPPYRYALDDKPWNGSPIQIGITAGIYTPKITDINGCSVALPPLEVTQRGELKVDLGPDITILLGQDTQLLVQVSNAIGGLRYAWSPEDSVWLSCMDCINPSVYNLDYQNYFEVLVTDSLGCSAEDQILVTVEKPRKVFVPTAFSPNDDLTNDRLLVHGQQTSRALNFRVFDRWGEMIYEAKNFNFNDPDVGWDGTFRDKPADPGVYVWVLEVQYVDGVVEVFRGNTTLIR
jgi:gliding motility-associated-like protein